MFRRWRTILMTGVVTALVAVSALGVEDIVRFGVFTDLHAHDLDSPLEGKWMTNTEERLTAFTEAMNRSRPDFVIQLGDFVNGWVVLGTDPGSPDRIPEILAWADAQFAAFQGPRYHVIGNHDVYNLDKATLRAVLGMERTSYSFDVGPFHFVVLDVQYGLDGKDLEHTYTGVSGYVPDALLAWLESDLAEARGRPTLVFVHQMLNEVVIEWNRALIANQAEVQHVLEQAGHVVAVLQGHDHAYSHELIGGIHYVTLEALVDQGTPPSWALVTLDAVSQIVRVDGFGEQPSLEFTYSLVPPAD
ncbi:MAG: metallophosphoesterase [Candidatus Bipolaricaulota bacterium]